MTALDALPTVALAVSTIGRPELAALLASAAASSVPPVAVAVADQSPGGLRLDVSGHPFPVVVVPSGGGVSRGRNDAVEALDGAGDVLAFPNDDTSYEPDVLEAVARCFASAGPAAVACAFDEPGGTRFDLPPAGRPLDRRSVWRAIEPATFVDRRAFEKTAGFRADIGSGAGTAWGSGEGTDLLLRLMEAGGQVLSRPDLAVHGGGERRDLDDDALVRKHRSYARGTGYVYRVHDYPAGDRLRTLAGPVVRATRLDDDLRLSLRLAAARFAGRLEGFTGRSLARGPGLGRRLEQ